MGNPHPAGHTLQHPVGPQDQALAEATCTARQANRLVPVDNSLIFINFMNRLRAKRTDSLTNRF
ncbi:MAG: hypothetical protein, partial [Olavius algarvensis Gamma 1 endosymbiont]